MKLIVVVCEKVKALVGDGKLLAAFLADHQHQGPVPWLWNLQEASTWHMAHGTWHLSIHFTLLLVVLVSYSSGLSYQVISQQSTFNLQFTL